VVSAVAPALVPTDVVGTTHGPVRGSWRDAPGRPAPGRGPRFDRSAAFYGIPFAAPPVGPLAFAAPQPREPWTEVLDATRHGATPQRRTLSDHTSIPEPVVPGDDTLVVDVFTPAPGGRDVDGTVVDPLPVLVWIHGGAFVAGSPASPWYDGATFNRDGVVTVNVSYRLGVVGFGEVAGAVPNRGVLDWIAALEWVRDNVAAFGGDPHRVTVAGQSAGGGAVLALLTAPRAAGLFRAAVAQSPAIFPGDPVASRALVARIADRLGVPATAEALAAVDERALVDAQYAETDPTAPDPAAPDPALGLEAAALEPGAEPAVHVASGPTTEEVLAGLREAVDTGVALGPVVDGDLLPVPVPDALRDGASRDVPLLLGTTAGEFDLALDSLATVVDALPAERFLATVGVPGPLARLYAARSVVRGLPTSRVGGHLVTDVVFRIPAAQAAESHARAGARTTWLYDFRWASRAPAHPGVATHCLDVPFVWDVLAAGDEPDPETGIEAGRVTAITGDAPPQALAELVHASWVSFVRDGEPGWAPYLTDVRTPIRSRRQVRAWDAVTRTVTDGYRFERVAAPALRFASRRGH
jgi:para-nitrobenzyl esterase